MEISIGELRDQLTEILHRANSGEAITVTLQRQPLCQITPMEVTASPLPTFLEKAAAEGWLIPATASGLKKIKRLRPKKSGPNTAEVLAASRRERNF